VPEWASTVELDADVRRDLRGLSKEGAEFVGAHLLAAGVLADEDPELAWLHARAARSKGGRVAVVRETVGLVAYRAGHWAEAISELRAARRMGGGPGHLAVLADCERALGNPDKAIEISRSTEAEALDPAAAAELTIVTAGARADLGQIDAALVTLEAAGATGSAVEPWTARLQFAYADLLARAGRRREALDWFMRAYDADTEDETDAAERIAELAGEPAEPDADPVPSSTDPVPATTDTETTDTDTEIGVAEPGTEMDAPDPATEPAGTRPGDPVPEDSPTVVNPAALDEPSPMEHPSPTEDPSPLDDPTAEPAAGPLFSHPDEPHRVEHE
jgi:tetratricopeptide (TPR) repeat protein